jgi:hypothetical protein
VITPTWERPLLLAEAIANVREQTYRPLEHVIVADGPDGFAERVVERIVIYDELAEPPYVTMQFATLGRHWSSFLPDSFAAAPMVVGSLMAHGSYQTWLADDERMTPEHIETLVDALESSGADFAYGRVRMHRAGQAPEHGYEIGADPPQLGQITNVLYRTDLLKRGFYPFRAGMTSDWACIAQWIAAGATWAYVDRCTLTHRIDH